MRKLIIIALVLTCSLTSFAQVFNKVKSSTVNFKIKNAGIGVDGKFKEMKATISLDEKNIANSKFEGIVSTKSVSTGIGLRDEHLRDKIEFFNSSKFPNMEMSSTKVSATNKSGIYKVEWKLTIKGISKTIATDVVAVKSGNILNLSSSFRINRRDWKIGGKSIMMNDYVDIKLNSSVTQ